MAAAVGQAPVVAAVPVARAAALLKSVHRSSAGGGNGNTLDRGGGSNLRCVTHPGTRKEVTINKYAHLLCDVLNLLVDLIIMLPNKKKCLSVGWNEPTT